MYVYIYLLYIYIYIYKYIYIYMEGVFLSFFLETRRSEHVQRSHHDLMQVARRCSTSQNAPAEKQKAAARGTRVLGQYAVGSGSTQRNNPPLPLLPSSLLVVCDSMGACAVWVRAVCGQTLPCLHLGDNQSFSDRFPRRGRNDTTSHRENPLYRANGVMRSSEN